MRQHGVLDVALGEDNRRIRTGPAAHNMAILKRIAHNLRRQDRSLKAGIAHKRLAAAWDKDYLCRLLGLKPKPIWMPSPWEVPELQDRRAYRTVQTPCGCGNVRTRGQVRPGLEVVRNLQMFPVESSPVVNRARRPVRYRASQPAIRALVLLVKRSIAGRGIRLLRWSVGRGMINKNGDSYKIDMKISERGQITIPKKLRDLFGMNKDVEVEITPTEHGLLIQKRTAAKHPVEKISGILDSVVDVDRYMEEIRGR